MAALFGLYPFLLKLYADVGYQGPGFQEGLKKATTQVHVEIVTRSDQAKGLRRAAPALGGGVHLRRRGRCRLAKDRECLNVKALAFVKLASIRLMIRRLHNWSLLVTLASSATFIVDTIVQIYFIPLR
ncbi:MAG: hypothetical protein EOR68_34025 [Mesorhizobium sp.]|nr:MAG: hypothetical protein EOR68_34025 [Mesorhizobium sp.]